MDLVYELMRLFLFAGEPLDMDLEISLASFDSISEVNMVSFNLD